MRKVRDPIFRFRFNESARYDIGPDQNDWNKLSGIKRHYFRPLRWNQMVVWRYRPDGDFIEVAKWIQVDGAWFVYAERPAQFGQWCEAHLEGSGFLVNSWFGGNRRAPHRITIDLEII